MIKYRTENLLYIFKSVNKQYFLKTASVLFQSALRKSNYGNNS